MEKTAVGLFENRMAAEKVVGELELRGLPPQKIQVLAEPLQFKSVGEMTSKQSEFTVDSTLELGRIGVTRLVVEAYLCGLRCGRTMVPATSSDKKSDVVLQIMTQSGAFDVEELVARSRTLPTWYSKDSTFPRWV